MRRRRSLPIGEKFAAAPRPWIVLGIGASHPDKDWPDEPLGGISRPGCGGATAGTVFLIGGNGELRARAELHRGKRLARATVNACELALTEAAALLRLADLFVGPISGPMNLAAAGATDAFGLFGSTPVLTYSKFIHPVVPRRAARRRAAWRGSRPSRR